MFEHHSEPPLSHEAFLHRLIRQFAYAGALIAASVMLGMAGYHWIAKFSWIDAFLNASMLLGGMGPIGDLRSSAAKLFAGVFALYSGLVFLAVELLLLAPIFHRVLHRFHAEASQRETQ